MFATRAYALLFVLTLLTAAAAEILPRGEPGAPMRDVKTGAIVVLALGSLAFALVTGSRRLLAARRPPRTGVVELEPDEDVEIDPVEAPHELGRLHSTRSHAIDTLLDQPPLRCSYCKTPWTPDVLGRVGKRVLVQRPPPGATSMRVVLAEGWWVRPAEPPPCSKCGSRDLVPD